MILKCKQRNVWSEHFPILIILSYNVINGQLWATSSNQLYRKSGNSSLVIRWEFTIEVIWSFIHRDEDIVFACHNALHSNIDPWIHDIWEHYGMLFLLNAVFYGFNDLRGHFTCHSIVTDCKRWNMANYIYQNLNQSLW